MATCAEPASLAKAVNSVTAMVNNAGITKTNRHADFHDINYGGTENILRAIENNNSELRRLVQISSTAACGPAGSKVPRTEDDEPRPLTAYGRSKLAAERAVLARKDNLPVIILRPCAVYGPRDKEMFAFFKSVKRGIKPAFGCSQSYINFTYAKDIARATALAIKTDVESGSVYFVAEKRSYSYSAAGDILAALFGRRAHDLYVPTAALRLAAGVTDAVARIRHKPMVFSYDKVNELIQKYWLFDTSRCEAELGLTSTDFKTGAAETIAWYKEKGWL